MVTCGNVFTGYTTVFVYMLVFFDLWFGLLCILFVLLGLVIGSENGK